MTGSSDGPERIRSAWRTRVAQAGDGLLMRREASWRERGHARRMTACACLHAEVVLADDGDESSLPAVPTDSLAVHDKRRRLSTSSHKSNSLSSSQSDIASAGAQPPLKRSSSFKRKNADEPKKNIRFAEARRSSVDAWAGKQKKMKDGLVIVPYFDGSFHTVWGVSPGAPLSPPSQDDEPTCECYCSLPWTARVWSASKWYLCFAPALCVPLLLPLDLLLGGCCQPPRKRPPPVATTPANCMAA